MAMIMCNMDKECLSIQTLSLAHWIVCSITEGKDLRVQNGISSSGGSLWKVKGVILFG